MTEAIASCHCGAVTLRLTAAPETVTRCNCSLCRRYGVLWAYYTIADITIEANAPTDTYAWNGKHIDFYRCADCGCVTHWYPRAKKPDRMGINARRLDHEVLDAAKLIDKDNAGTGLFR